METTTPSLRRLLLPLLFVAFSVVVALGVWKEFGGTLPLEPQGYRFTTPVPQADAILPNSDVRIAGVSVGHVVDVRRTGRSAQAVVELDPEHAPIRTGARTIARSKTLLGEGYLEIAPGPRSAPPLRDGGTLATANAQRTQRLDDALQTFDPQARTDLRRLFGGLAAAFDGRGEDLNDVLGAARPASTDLRALLATLHGQRRQLGEMTRDAATVFGVLGDRSASIESMVQAGSRALSATASRDRRLRETIDELPAFLLGLRRSTRSLARTSPSIDRAVAALRPVVPHLERTLEALPEQAPSFRRLFRALPQLMDHTEPGLPALQRVLDAATPAAGPVYEAARELIPFMQLADMNSRSIVGSITNMSSMINGQFQAHGGKIASYATGQLSVWNEIVGGWTKKLPSNRSNPYPAPNSADDMARGGLKAYDCRNVNNPMILPVIGFGVPDCKVQGPWTFNGKTRYYPRLERAAP